MSAQDILVLAEVHQDKPADITYELLGAARQLAKNAGGEVVALLLGQKVQSLASSLIGADRIVVIEDSNLAGFLLEPYLAVVEAIVNQEQPQAVILGSTTIGLDLASPLAFRLNAPVVIGCIELQTQDHTLRATSKLYGGKLLIETEICKTPAIFLVLPGCFQAAKESGKGVVEVKPSPVALQPGAVVLEKMIFPAAGDIDITQQDILVSVGRGIQNKDNIEKAEELAQLLGGAVSSSRPIVDQGWLPPTRQVGKSGMNVRPKCYLALGISGAPEHQEGMKNSQLIIAINTDPNAPIFDIAQYGVVDDLFNIVPQLIDQLKTK